MSHARRCILQLKRKAAARALTNNNHDFCNAQGGGRSRIRLRIVGARRRRNIGLRTRGKRDVETRIDGKVEGGGIAAGRGDTEHVLRHTGVCNSERYAVRA